MRDEEIIIIFADYDYDNNTKINMAENKKEMERAELHRTIWAIADDMRGAVDGWDFKAYILAMLFYRYISENITNYINKANGILATQILITPHWMMPLRSAYAKRWWV